VPRPVFPSGRDTALDLWNASALLVAWLDANNGHSDLETAHRFMHLVTEVGEAHEAYLGKVGQNPRKGVTNGMDKVTAELCDVIVGAANILTTLVGADEARACLDSKLTALLARAGHAPAEVTR
jgi:hypothetical protein